MNNISAIIVAKHNPPYLFKTIESVSKLVSEIVVVDIGLTNEVVTELQKNSQVRIEKISTEVLFVEQIRETSKQYATHEYILFLDPDEIIPQKLSEMIADNYEKYDYISFPRKNIIMGKFIEHSRWWPDYQTRVFKKNSVTWPKILHAQPELTGQGFKIEAKEEQALIHYNYENLTEFLEKMIRYAKSDANGKASYSLHEALSSGIQEFISRYFAADGYKDGMHGFMLSFLQLLYYPLVYFFYWEHKKYEPVSEKEIIQEASYFTDKIFSEVKHWLSAKNLVSGATQLKYKIMNRFLK